MLYPRNYGLLVDKLVSCPHSDPFVLETVMERPPHVAGSLRECAIFYCPASGCTFHPHPDDVLYVKVQNTVTRLEERKHRARKGKQQLESSKQIIPIHILGLGVLSGCFRAN